LKKYFEIIFYVSFSAGMAFGTSCFMMIAGLSAITTAGWSVLAIFLSALLCILISASIAELASMYPSAPGIRTYLKVSFDDRLSLTLVYLYLIFMVLVAGVESYLFARVTKVIFPGLPTMGIVFGLLAFTIIVNTLGLELPRSLQIISTLLLLLSVITLGVYGIVKVNPAVTGSSLIDGSNVLGQLKLLPATIIMAVFLFTGFEWVTMLGLRPQAYERRIPLSMPLAIVTLLLVYSVFASALSYQLPRQTISDTPVPQVLYFISLLGPNGGYVAWGISVLAIFSTFNAGIMGGARLIYVLTREGNLPKWCGRMSLRTGAPVGGIITLGALVTVSSVLVVTYELELLAAVVGSAIVSFVYAAYVLAAIVLRRKQPKARRTFRTPSPRWLQWSLVFLLPAMGLASLFSQVNMQFQPALTLTVLIVLAWFMAHRSLLRVGRPTPNSVKERI
jgi:amino acid transporter